MKKRLIGLVLLSLSWSADLHAKDYSFAIVPQQSATKLAKLWGPVLTKLSAETGLSIKFTTAKDIPTFEARLAAGEYDFAYMNPYHYTVFSQSPGYVALANQKGKRIQGIMVVKKQSPLQSLVDLDAQQIAFPSPAAFAASVLPRAELNKQQISHVPKYVSSHDSVYLAVARGLVSAGGGIMRTFNNTDPAIRSQLRILWKTKKYTPHAFAAHPRVSEDHRAKIQQALIGLEDSEAGRSLLAGLNLKPIQAAADDSWDDVRALNLTALDE